MSTLANTTWNFVAQGKNPDGTITFQLAGPSLHSGPATIAYADPTQGTVSASWAEAPGGRDFVIQFSDFGPSQNNSFPPPLGVPTINSGTNSPGLVTLFGTHIGGIATMFGTNFQTLTPTGHVLGTFSMQIQA